MAIADAGKLGDAISKHSGDLDGALQDYQQERIPQTTREVRILPLCDVSLDEPSVHRIDR